MQAYKAYYEDGWFVPLDMPEIPKGTQAIVTLLDFSPNDGSRRQAEAMRRFREEIRNSDESVSEFERVKFEEIK